MSKALSVKDFKQRQAAEQLHLSVRQVGAGRRFGHGQPDGASWTLISGRSTQARFMPSKGSPNEDHRRLAATPAAAKTDPLCASRNTTTQ